MWVTSECKCSRITEEKHWETGTKEVIIFSNYQWRRLLRFKFFIFHSTFSKLSQSESIFFQIFSRTSTIKKQFSWKTFIDKRRKWCSYQLLWMLILQLHECWMILSVNYSDTRADAEREETNFTTTLAGWREIENREE